MQLTVRKRADLKKSKTKAMRREGSIPAVLYAPGRPAESIAVETEQFEEHLRHIKQGRLPTTIFTLSMGERECRAIIKDIHYHVTTYRVDHLDFEELLENTPVVVKVPVTCVGVADCLGIKLGGFLRQVVRHVKVKCLPKNIPAEFAVNVQALGVMQKRTVSDIQMPEAVTPLLASHEVVAMIGKRAG